MNKKLVAVINKDLNSGVAMNALAHAEAFLHLYSDASGNHWAMSGMSFIILRANALQIKNTFLQAKAADITHVVFVDGMTCGDYIEQIEKNSQFTDNDGLQSKVLNFLRLFMRFLYQTVPSQCVMP